LSSVKSRAFFLFIPRKANEKISGGRKIRNKNRWHCDRSLKNLGGNTRAGLRFADEPIGC